MSIANKRLSVQNSRLLYRNIGTVMFYTAYQDYAADNRKKRKKKKKKKEIDALSNREHAGFPAGF